MSAYNEVSLITKIVSRTEDFVITKIYCSSNESQTSWARIYCIWKSVSLRNRPIIVRKNVVFTHICVGTRSKNSYTVRGKYCKFTFTLFTRIAAALFPQLLCVRNAFSNGFMIFESCGLERLLRIALTGRNIGSQICAHVHPELLS